MNFIQKEEESNLAKLSHPDLVLNVMKLLFIMLGEDYESIPLNKLAESLVNDLLPKYKVESLSINRMIKIREFNIKCAIKEFKFFKKPSRNND